MGIAANVTPVAIPETTPPIVPTPPIITPETAPFPADITIDSTEQPDTSMHQSEVVLIDTVLQKDTIIFGAESNIAALDTPVQLTSTPLSTTPLTTTTTTTRKPAGGNTSLTMVLLFGVIFSLLAWGLSLNRELLKKIYRAALNENLSSLLYREQRFATTQYLYYTIYIIFFLNGGMFLYFLSRHFGWTAWTFQSIWSSIGLVFVIYMLRHLSLSILGSTYPITKEATHFSFSIVLHNILLGIGLIPVNLFLAFGPDGMYRTIAVTGLLFCGLIYLIRQFRGLLISGSAIVTNPFHFFVYLCAVEILPLFTLVRFFHN